MPLSLHRAGSIYQLPLRFQEDLDRVIQELYEVYDAAPHLIRAHAPQICSFLLHGHLQRAERLEVFILDKVRSLSRCSAWLS
jgi:hypothetical protein